MFGSTLLVVLALATLVVLVGGRMTDDVRRVGTLKAAGATPGFVARLLLASYLAVGLVAALLGLVTGRLLAPRLVTRSAGLLGRLGGTSVSLTDGLVVTGSILAIVVIRERRPGVASGPDEHRAGARRRWARAAQGPAARRAGRLDCPRRHCSACGWPDAGPGAPR